MPARTLAELFETHCRAKGDCCAYAFVADDLGVRQEYSYRQLHDEVHRVAAWIMRRTRPGDRVLLALPTGLDFVRVFWGCVLSGRVAVPVPAPEPVRLRHAAPRLHSIITDSDAALVITSAPLLNAAATALDPALLAHARWLAVPASGLLAPTPAGTVWPAIEAEDLAYLQYTSGSTAAPRGACLSHANVLAATRALARAGHGNARSRLLNWLPHFHDYGLVFGIVMPMVLGATGLLISPLTFLRRPLRWLEAIERHGATHSAAPESAFVACLQALGDRPLAPRLDSLVSLSCGAEPIRASTVTRVLSVFGAAGLRPGVFAPSYGLAEAVLAVTVGTHRGAPRILRAQTQALLLDQRFEPAAEDAPAREVVGCGQPLDGMQVLIVDVATATACADGCIGEIWVRSAAVGRGYWGSPEHGQGVFDARLADGDGPFLRTGDLGFLDGGELFITGRSKDLIIVHGANHYPQDLEWSAERAHPDLRPDRSAAFAVDTPAGEAVALVLEIERRHATGGDWRPIFEAVRHAIAVEHGLPVHTIALVRAGTLPRTSSGKIQRQRCRAAFLADELALLACDRLDDDTAQACPDAPNADAAPQCALSADERTVRDIWSEVLGTRAFGMHDSFLALGGNSLRMTQVISRVKARLGVELPLTGMLEYTSMSALAAQVALQRTRAPAVPGRTTGIERVERGTALPASLSQRRMWVIQQFDPSSTAYNVPVAIRLRGALDLAACRQALQAMVDRHEALRTRFVMGADEPMQWIESEIALPFEFIDLSDSPRAQEQARELLSQRTVEPFDLERAPLHRVTLLRLGPDEYVLFWLLHHAITDNWSSVVLLRETLAAYGQLIAGRAPETAPPAIGYADYAAWQRHPDAVRSRQPQLAYWRERLRGLPDLDLPTDFPRPTRASFIGARVSAPLPAPLHDAVRAFSQRESVTPFVFFLSVFALLLSRHARSEDLAIGTPIANRHHFDSEHLVGTLVNTLVMRADLSGEPSFTEFVHRMRSSALEAFAHQDAPFDELTDALNHDRVAHPEGLVRVLFNVLNAPLGDFDRFELQIDEFDFERRAVQFDLSMHIDTEFGQRVHLDYASDLYAPASAQRLLDSFLWLAAELVAHPDAPLSAQAIVPPAQRAQLRACGQGPRAPLPAQPLVHRLLDLGDPAVRERVAVIVAEGEHLSYGELEARSNRLAHALRAGGIARGKRVGLCIERSPDLLIAQLAVLKAGAAYVPLDPEYPAERLRFMAADADLSLLLVHADDAAILGGVGVSMRVIDHARLELGQPPHPLEPDARLDATPDDDAYLIYTSGSTGQPKGVRVQHRNVVNFLDGMMRQPGLAVDDCVVAITSPSFDPSVLDLMLPLRVRARVVVASRTQAHDPHALSALLQAHEATLLQATPSAWRMLIAAGWHGSPRLRALVGGEALSPRLAEQLLERCGALWNIYGPTETTVWTTCWKVASPRHGISLGRPIANTSVWVLDAQGRVCPFGVPGEIHIGGAGVVSGYYHRDELTAERFVPDPFSDEPGARLYRTGDLGRWRHDGQLEYLGRMDHQVKLRGHRIELGEIEAALLDHRGVAQCVTLTRSEHEEDVRLVAYCVARGAAAPPAAMLREHLRARLPHYMIPQHFVMLDAMPLLPNGKINRDALPAPATESAAAARDDGAPQTPAEAAMAAIWAELLSVEGIGRNDNFFDLGGHSLLAMRAATAVHTRMGWRIDPRRFIFESLAQLANEKNLAPVAQAPVHEEL